MARKNSALSGSLMIIALVMGVFAIAAAPAVAQEEPAAAAPSEAAEAAPAAQSEPAEPQMAEAQRVFRSSSTVIIDGKAEANGVLSLIFEPNGGEAKLVRVNVPAKMKAKKIVQELANQFTFTVGTNYKVKKDDKKLTVKAKNKKAVPFWIGIEEQSLMGVSVRVTK